MKSRKPAMRIFLLLCALVAFNFLFQALSLFSGHFQAARERSIVRTTRHSRGLTVVVTMDCANFSAWQNVVAMYNYKQMRAAGSEFYLVRLISCHNEPRAEWFDSDVANETHVVFPMGDPYPFEPMRGFSFPTLNKPYALMDWMYNRSGQQWRGDEELLIIDVDGFFMRPLGRYFVSAPGAPVGSELYGLRSWYLNNETNSLREFCGSGERERARCASQSDYALENYYDVGPPLFVRVADFRKIVLHWFRITELLVLAADKNVPFSAPGGWLADMYAYAMGAVIENLPHQQITGYSVFHQSHFTFFDQSEPVQPTWLHYCHDYDLRAASEGDKPFAMRFFKHDWHMWTGDDVDMLNCTAGERDPLFFLKLHAFNAPPEFFADEPPQFGFAWSREDAYRRTLWFLWQIKTHFEPALTDWRATHCA